MILSGPDLIDRIIKRYEFSCSLRGNWESVWQEIGDRVLPQAAEFNVKRTDGDKRTELMFDGTPALALQKFSAAIESFLTPRNQRWHKLEVSDPYLAKSQAVKAYLDEVTDILFRVRYSARASFAGQSNEAYLSLGAFGTGGMFVDDDVESAQIRYKSLPLHGTHILENQHGRVDTVFRSFKRTLRQIEQKWPDRLPPKLKAMMVRTPDEKVEVLHFVGPRVDYQPAKLGPASMPWHSCYLLPGEKTILDEGGYTSWPLGFCRYMTSADEVYGRGPAWLALSNIKVLNEQKKTILKAGHKAVDPPLLASDDGILSAFSQVPGAMNYGGLDNNGNQLVKPLVSGARVDIGMDMMEREREIINDSFLVTLFQILVETPTMTATEVLERAQEKAALLAPVIGRQQSEFLGSIIEREIDILAQAGQLPPMPDEMIEAQGEYTVQYTSPLTRAMRASDGIAIVRTLESVIPLSQIKPDILDVFNLDEAARELAEINGMPAKIMRDPKMVAAMKEQRAQMEQAQALLQAAPVVAQTAESLSKLQASGGMPA